MKKLIPPRIKVSINKLRKDTDDLFKGHFFRFAKKGNSDISFPYSIKKYQELKPTNFSEAKKHNIIKAIKSIESVEINPNEIFSFWKIVGKLSKRRGFKDGITIVNGELTTSSGGGICQITGLIYHVCLEINLDILERHNHSVDLYTDETRYTPLGSDATVVYGYKDLRVRNNFDFPIKFTFSITDESLLIQVNSTQKIERNEVTFIRDTISEKETEVITMVKNRIRVRSKYKNLNIL